MSRSCFAVCSTVMFSGHIYIAIRRVSPPCISTPVVVFPQLAQMPQEMLQHFRSDGVCSPKQLGIWMTSPAFFYYYIYVTQNEWIYVHSEHICSHTCPIMTLTRVKQSLEIHISNCQFILSWNIRDKRWPSARAFFSSDCKVKMISIDD